MIISVFVQPAGASVFQPDCRFLRLQNQTGSQKVSVWNKKPGAGGRLRRVE
jgi:hypothetical protein